jgi:acyl dehydratase
VHDLLERTAVLYLDDLTPGRRFPGGSVAISETDIIAFASAYDPQPFHLSEATAAGTFFGGLAASGWQVAALTMRLLVDGGLPVAGVLRGASAEIAWPTATRPGDVLSVTSEIIDVTPSRSKPDRGVVTVRIETSNQRGEIVQRLTCKIIAFKRPAA